MSYYFDDSNYMQLSRLTAPLQLHDPDYVRYNTYIRNIRTRARIWYRRAIISKFQRIIQYVQHVRYHKVLFEVLGKRYRGDMLY